MSDLVPFLIIRIIKRNWEQLMRWNEPKGYKSNKLLLLLLSHEKWIILHMLRLCENLYLYSDPQRRSQMYYKKFTFIALVYAMNKISHVDSYIRLMFDFHNIISVFATKKERKNIFTRNPSPHEFNVFMWRYVWWNFVCSYLILSALILPQWCGVISD